MTDKAQKILNKVAGAEDIAAKAILKATGQATHYGIQIPRGRILKAIGSGLRTRAPLGPTTPAAETMADVIKRRIKTAGIVDETVDVLNSQQAGYRGVYDPRKRIKVAGVVDRSVAEINELQWGYRHMRNPFAEANSTSRNTNYMADYFAKQSGLIPGGLADKAGKTAKDFDPKELKKGMKVEREHTSQKGLEKEIAMDHLTEDPHYYEKLQKMEKKSAKLRDVDPRNRIVAKARERGGLIGSGVGMSAAYLLTKNPKLKPLVGALGVVPGFVAGKAVAGTAAKAFEETKRAPKGSHNFHKKGELEKIAIIRKENDGYHIYAHSGRHLGGPYSLEHAKKRLQQIEYFKKQGAFLDKMPKLRRGIATAMTAGALTAPAKGGIGDLAKALEKEAPKLEAASPSRVFYHKPESAEAQKYVSKAGLKGPHWVTSDTLRTTLPTGAERRHIETLYFPQESGNTMREVTKEVVNKKYPDLVDRESWLKEIDYDEAKKYLEMKKTLATK